MFSVTPDGATSSANLYSLVQTVIANKLNSYEYLKNVFEKLSIAQNVKDLLSIKVKT